MRKIYGWTTRPTRNTILITISNANEKNSNEYSTTPDSSGMNICNFVRVPKAWRWAHVQSFNSKCNKKYDFSNIHILESSRNVSETSPGYIQRSEAYNANKINAFPQRRITVNCPEKIGTVWDNGKCHFLWLDNTQLSDNNSAVSAWYQCDPQLSHFLCLSNENRPVLQQCG